MTEQTWRKIDRIGLEVLEWVVAPTFKIALLGVVAYLGGLFILNIITDPSSIWYIAIGLAIGTAATLAR